MKLGGGLVQYDQISLSEVKQTGAKGIVSALHEIPYGDVWPTEAVVKIKDQAFGFHMGHVIESLPVHEQIKKGTGNLSQLFANYRQS